MAGNYTGQARMLSLLLLALLLLSGLPACASAQPVSLVEAASNPESRANAPVPLNMAPADESDQAEPSRQGDAAQALSADAAAVRAVEPVLLSPVNHETINVLILGSDRRPRDPNWRTDVIMVLMMDLANGQAGLISLPRDLYLDQIPNHQPNRVNVVDYLGERNDPGGGGPALLSGILEDKLGLKIDHYLRFEFEGFKDVVDALGGLEIEVDCAVSDYLPEEDTALRLTPGVHRLDGAQALAYVRTRRQGGDLERVRRQQRTLWAVREQIARENLLPKVPSLYAALRNSVQTDIGPVNAIRYARFALSLEQEAIHGFVVSPPLVREGWQRGMFVFIADWEAIRQGVAQIFERPPLIQTNTVGEEGERRYCP
jgi:LCP family protein required for cell wall assembly